MSVVGALGRFARAPSTGPGKGTTPRARESCELCQAPIGERHDHLVDLDQRSLCCACRACALLFQKQGAARGRYKTVPDRVLRWEAKGPEQETLAALQIPVGLAFFFFNSRLERWVALYPGPAGSTESELPMEAWAKLSEGNPLIAGAAPDVEAILVNARRAPEQAEWFLVPIDACYELVGTIRTTWKGFDGGDRAREAVESFFARLRERSRP